MQRMYTKDVPKPDGGTFAKKGDIRDYPMETWLGIARSLYPKAKGNIRDKLDDFSSAMADIGNLIPDKKRARA